MKINYREEIKSVKDLTPNKDTIYIRRNKSFNVNYCIFKGLNLEDKTISAECLEDIRSTTRGVDTIPKGTIFTVPWIDTGLVDKKGQLHMFAPTGEIYSVSNRYSDTGDETISHPSFGKVVLSRYTHGDKGFYGSNITTQNSVGISIYGSEWKRGLNRDWYHTTDCKIQIAFTPNQWANFLSSFHNGDGTPCTIDFTKTEGSVIPYPFQDVSKKETFEREFAKEIHKTKQVIKEAQESCEIFNDMG